MKIIEYKKEKEKVCQFCKQLLVNTGGNLTVEHEWCNDRVVGRTKAKDQFVNYQQLKNSQVVKSNKDSKKKIRWRKVNNNVVVNSRGSSNSLAIPNNKAMTSNNGVVNNGIIINNGVMFKEIKNENEVIRFIKVFSRKIALQNLMALIQYHSPLKIRLDLSLLLSLVEKFRIFIFKKNQAISYKEVEWDIDSKLMSLSIQSFFDNCCLVFNFIDKNRFSIDQRSPLLKWSIIAAGLSWLSQDQKVKEALYNINMKLETMLSCINNVKHNLDTVQAILVIVIHLPHFSLTSLYRNHLFVVAQCMASIIGLHNKSLHLPKKIIRERILTYNTLNLVAMLNSLWSDVPVMTPYKIRIPSKIRGEYTSIHDTIIMLFNEYLSELSGVIFSLRLVKGYFAATNISSDKLNQHCTTIKIQLRKTSLNYYFKLTSLQQNSSSVSIYQHLMYLKVIVQVLYHFHQYYILSLYFFQQPLKGMNYELLYTRDRPSNKTTQEAIKQCQLCIELLSLLPKQYLVFYGFTNLAQCLTFLIRYHKKISCGVSKQYICKGFNIYHSLTSTLVYSNHSLFNLSLIGCIEAITNSNK
ncbi:hypothetical protein K502DRAFT_350380 [Neoconidiobolus thromboides FSU 785]|nr:hypothetical protein K502DRAFT_350380 [Neoconidiobolus thromboides FSU 785]